MCYSLFFSGVVGTELVIIASQFFLHGLLPSIDLIYLAVTNIIATVLFMAEGLQLRRKTTQTKGTETQKEPLDKTIKADAA
jgi:uncharacterized membrane protein YciS (DUF1049 family)